MLGLIGLLLFLTIGFLLMKNNKKKVIESVAFSKFLNDKSKVDEEQLNPDKINSNDGVVDKINNFFDSGPKSSSDDDGDSE